MEPKKLSLALDDTVPIESYLQILKNLSQSIPMNISPGKRYFCKNNKVLSNT